MTAKMTLIDAHCHLANLSSKLSLEPLLTEAAEYGITRFLSSALRGSEVQYYLDHQHPGVLFSAGIHPNYGECDLSLDDIAGLCAEHRIWAVGEIGLDRNGPPLPEQEKTFIAQLELAEKHRLPVVLHIVGHQQRAYEILKSYPLRYLVHAYAGSIEGYRLLASLDSFFTVSDRILRADKISLLKEMVAGGRYLAETDITWHYVEQEEPNPLLRLVGVVKRACDLGQVTRADFVAAQNAAYEALTEHLHD